jgi:pyruvate-formate lyase-activating enzyme
MPRRLSARIEIDVGARSFASGVLVDLIDVLRRASDGDLVALTSHAPAAVEPDLDAWSRLTGYAIVGRTSESNGTVRWVIRRGETNDDADARPIGERLWLYLNFDCNLQCDYCCVRSSPTAPRRALGLDVIRRVADEAPALGVREFFATGGEPFLLPDIADQLLALAAMAPVTVLTNGMLFRGQRLASLRRLPRDRVTLQISLDSPDPALHDTHRGQGTWQRALEGMEAARQEGFRVRLAATVASDRDEAAFRAFLETSGIPHDDRVIRRIALRGFATSGVALSRADLIPEVTLTAEGVYWHPVGAEDADLLVTTALFPLDAAFAAVRESYAHERVHATRVASIFRCA